jgi:hypothetical protein
MDSLLRLTELGVLGVILILWSWGLGKFVWRIFDELFRPKTGYLPLALDPHSGWLIQWASSQQELMAKLQILLPSMVESLRSIEDKVDTLIEDDETSDQAETG